MRIKMYGYVETSIGEDREIKAKTFVYPTKLTREQVAKCRKQEGVISFAAIGAVDVEGSFTDMTFNGQSVEMVF